MSGTVVGQVVILNGLSDLADVAIDLPNSPGWHHHCLLSRTVLSVINPALVSQIRHSLKT